MELSKDIKTKDLKEVTLSLRKSLAELIIPLACLCGAGLLIFLVIVPGIKNIQEGREKVEEREELLAKLEQKNSVLSKYASQINDLDTDLLLVRNAVPREEKIPELMTQIQDMAREASVSISGLQYGGSKSGKEDEVKSVQLQLSVEGEYSQIEELFKLFENSSRIVVLNQFGLRNQHEASTSANLGLSSFYLKAPDKTKIEEPIEEDFTSDPFKKIIEKIEDLKLYEVKVEKGQVGKENPFSE